ncbi:MAG: ABC transporter [Hyphococcus sp.]|nr:MAG: ABC transporter [Marinicaulis sp.]
MTRTATINLDKVSVGESATPRLSNVTVTFQQNELTAIIGPNGAGKSTLLKCALGLTEPDAGAISINNKALTSLSPIERARIVSYLPQMRALAWPLKVRDVVALGRFAYGGALGRLKAEDAAAVDQAIISCGLERLRDRNTDTLSGGELARVHCARAFAAQTPLLIADEPVASLDPHHQFKIMAFIKDYVTKGGGAVVVLHDLSLAASFADRLIWMKDGKINADGSPDETMTRERIQDVFDVSAEVSKRDDGALQVTMTGV